MHINDVDSAIFNIFVEGDQARPGRTVTDKAYGQTQHFQLLHTCAELLQMQPCEHAIAEEEASHWMQF